MSSALPSLAGGPDGPVRRFAVDEYHRLIDVGVLSEDEPVELI